MSRLWSKLTEPERVSLLGTANELRKAGESWRQIEKKIGIDAENLRRALDPDFHRILLERKRIGRARLAERRKNGTAAGQRDSDSRKAAKVAYRKANWAAPPRDCRIRIEAVDRELIDQLMRAIPEDTRSTTARLCGDPLPGRSALDQEKQEGKMR